MPRSLVVSIGAVVACEVLLQVLGLGHPALVTTNSTANYELSPNQSTRRLWPMSDSWVAHVRTNSFGMRSDPISERKNAGTLRIYFVGDSITYGTTQVDQGQLFTELVHHELGGQVHKPVEVMNGSISGWAIANELAYVKEHGIFHADRVILVLNDGDPTQPMSPKPTDERIPSLECHPVCGLQELWERGLRPSIGRLFERHKGSRNVVAVGDPGLVITDDATILDRNLVLLDTFKSVVDESDGKLSVLYIPFRGVYDDRKLYERAAVGRDAVAGWARGRSVPFFNVGPELARYPTTAVVLRDHGHFNVLGHRIIADAIERNWSTLVP